MKRGPQGFTLLEILVALAVAGMVFVVLSGGFRFGLRALDTQVSLDGHSDDLLVTDRIFRLLIGQAMTGSGQNETPFHGAAHSVRFTTLLKNEVIPTVAGAADVSFGLDTHHRLVVTWQPHYLSSGTEPAGARVEVLAESIGQVDLSYTNFDVNHALVWQQDWHDDGLPALVRLHVVMRNKDERPIPDIVAQTRLRDRAQ